MKPSVCTLERGEERRRRLKGRKEERESLCVYARERGEERRGGSREGRKRERVVRRLEASKGA